MRSPRIGRILSSVSERVLHIEIDVSFADDQIRGHVRDGAGQAKPFSGWLGLIGALDGMLGSPPQEPLVAGADDHKGAQ